MSRHNFKELKIWQRSKELVKSIYSITKDMPNDENFGLIYQMRKSVISIPSNIAEGCCRGTNKQLAHFLDIAQGSAFELETRIIILFELNMIDENNYKLLSSELSELQRMIDGFKKTL